METAAQDSAFRIIRLLLISPTPDAMDRAGAARKNSVTESTGELLRGPGNLT